MVKDTGEATSPSAIKPINRPELVRVKEARDTRLLEVEGISVASVVDRWRIDDEWWREGPISRMYYRILLEDGHSLTIFQDLKDLGWYRQHYD